MGVLRVVVGSVVSIVWGVMFFYAAFVDQALIPLAQDATKPMLAVVGALFAAEGFQLVRKSRDDDPA